MLNRVWRGGNLTHMFSRQSFCQLSAPCLQLVRECHTVSPNECCFNGRKKLVQEKWDGDFVFFFSINWKFLIWLGRSHSGHSQRMQQGIFHTRYTSTLLHFFLKMFPHNKRWNWREISVTNTDPTKKPSVSLRLNFADLAAESSGQFLRLSIDSKFKFSLLVLRVKMGHILAHSHLYDLSHNLERTGGRQTSRKQQ